MTQTCGYSQRSDVNYDCKYVHYDASVVIYNRRALLDWPLVIVIPNSYRHNYKTRARDII